MKIFKEHPVVFYSVLTLGFILVNALSLAFQKAYVVWTLPAVIASLGIIGAIYLLAVLLIGLLKGRKPTVIAIEAVIFAALPVGTMALSDAVIKTAFNLGNVASGYVSLFVLVIISVTLAIVIASEAKKEINAPKASTVTAILLAVVMVSTFALPIFKDEVGNIGPFNFTSEPAVYVSGNGNYRVIFSTNTKGTGELNVTDKEGVTHTYYDQVNGVQRFHSIFHRVDVPASVLDGGTYTVVSKQTKNAKGYGVPLGKRIESKPYAFHDYHGDGDVSFICISDIQGPYVKAQNAVTEASEKYDYDFVLMLGDASGSYNDYEEDFVEANLKVASKASRSEIPVYYVIGNHENKGVLAKEVTEVFPTPSETGDLYYTFTVGDAFFTALNFGDDHNDDMARYCGVNHFNEYKDREYDWLKNTVIPAGEYKNYRYNLVVSHIPAIAEDEMRMDEYICGECNQKHDYKWTEFIEAYEEMGVQYVVSGHTHSEPREVTDETCSFVNLQSGSLYNDDRSFRNSIVFLKDGTYSYVVYGAE